MYWDRISNFSGLNLYLETDREWLKYLNDFRVIFVRIPELMWSINDYYSDLSFCVFYPDHQYVGKCSLTAYSWSISNIVRYPEKHSSRIFLLLTYLPAGHRVEVFSVQASYYSRHTLRYEWRPGPGAQPNRRGSKITTYYIIWTYLRIIISLILLKILKLTIYFDDWS